MTQRLQNKRALVTAAGNGIGLASALAMAREGAEVWATDINQDALAQLARQAQPRAWPGCTRVLDVLDTQAVQACAQEIGALDALFNCAGHVHAGNILECPESDWDFAMDLNAKSMHRTIRAFLPAMLERGGGSIINMSSAASSVKGVPNRYAYGASKAAVIGLTKAVAADFVARGIRCNAICPGTIESPSLRDRIAAQAPRPAPTTRPCAPPSWPASPSAASAAPKVAALAVYLASDESAFTTGTIQVIDGGWSN